MPKLPGIQDLGPTPHADSARPVASYDVSSIARGGAALAQGTERLGQGVAKFGEGIADVQLDKNRWDYAKAHSDFLARKIELDAETAKDTNYGADEAGKTLPQRYDEKLKDLHSKSAALIADPRMREHFDLQTRPLMAQGLATIDAHARGLENDASIAYVQQQGDNLINKAVGTPDDATRTQLIDSHNQLVDGLAAKGAIKPEQALAMKRAWAQQYATADYLAAVNSNDPARIQAAVNRLRAEPGGGDAVTDRILQVEGDRKNPRSSADGPGQFLNSTWLDVLKRNRPDLAKGRSDDELLALRADRNLARDLTGVYREENAAALKAKGLEATPGNQYLAHFLGAGGAAAVLKADPKMPVEQALAGVVGPERAKKMVEANPEVLGGQLAGSVKDWADAKMGGSNGHAYELLHLRPELREQLLAKGEAQLHKETTNSIATFHNSVRDDLAEADRAGVVTKPKTVADFIGAYGADHGPPEFTKYKLDLQAASDKRMLVSATPAQMRELIGRYEPVPGDGYAAGVQRQERLYKAAAALVKERDEDPAGYGVKYLPAVQESWQALAGALNDPTAKPETRATFARDYAVKQQMEQQRLGVAPDDIRIVPQGYVDRITDALAAAATHDDPKARVGLIAQVQREAQTWGDNWPSVMRQMSEKTQPMVRAIAAGADVGAMTRLLSVSPKDESPSAVLKQQNETKARDLGENLNTEMKPYLDSLVGRQRDRDYTGYYNMAKELGALYIRDGKSAPDAARDAFNALIGARYEFKDTWRMPKSAGVSADEVQAGVQSARNAIVALAAAAPAPPVRGGAAVNPLADIAAATDDVGLGEKNRADSLTAFARDGKWVTSPDNNGLNLVYGDKMVRRRDGTPLFMPWANLAKRGKDAAASFDAREGYFGGAGVHVLDILGPGYDQLMGIARSVKINPEGWDRFIKNAPQSRNIEDRRGEDYDPAEREAAELEWNIYK